MTASLVNVRSKKVPTLYEADESKYAGPHKWQIQGWARLVRRLMRRRAYTRWLDQSCSEINIHGSEHLANLDGPAIFVANHQSHLDTIVVHSALPEKIRRKLFFGAAQDRWFVKGKKKLSLNPWYQSLVMGNFPILRGGGKRALNYAQWLLSNGQCIFLFPEGTRATDQSLGEFKHGATLLAMAQQVPIVPIHLHGLQAIRAKGQREAKRGVVDVTILPPVILSADSDVAEATAMLRNRLNEMHCAKSGAQNPNPHIPKAA